jgi:flagellar FliL protein
MATTTTKQPKADPKAAPRQEAQSDAAETAANPKKKRGLLKLLLLLVLLLGGAGGGAWYFLQQNHAAAAAKPGAANGAAAKPAASKPPVFVTLEPFTVNLQHDDTSPQYLQVGLALKLADAGAVDAIKLRMPEIRNRVLLLLSGKKASDISSVEGKQTLSTELVREISQPLAGSVPAPALDSVLFTSFVIQ